MNLYLHVPFCARRCSYCDFSIAVRRRVPSARFVESILREWRGVQSLRAWDATPDLETVYFGGGTPSHLDPNSIKAILAGLQAERRVLPTAELTLEANPDDVTPAAAEAWLAAGIGRISLGVQSFSPAVLDWMHRTHTADQAREALRTLRSAGFADLSLDLIYGLPAGLGRAWADDLDEAFALEPDHLSCYGLTVEAHTPLGRWTASGRSAPVDEAQYAEEFLELSEALVSRGWEHYEVSNASRPGRRARHNSGYWEGDSYLGLGPSAHSASGGERWWNIREYAAWDAAIEHGDDPVAGRERLDDAQRRLESLYLGLRTTRGAPAGLIPVAVRSRWREAGWASEAGGFIRLSVEGWLRLDALVAEAA